MSTDPTTPRTKASTVKLSTRQQFQLLDWLRDHEPEVKEKPDTQLFRIASAELGFDLTISNFTHAREAARITKNTPPAPPTVEERLARLEKTVGTFIAWSQQHLGEHGATALLKMLSESPVPSSPPPPVPSSSETLLALETPTES